MSLDLTFKGAGSVTIRVPGEEILKGIGMTGTPPENDFYELGYISPSQIISYMCNKCNKESDGSPKMVASIYEDFARLAYRCGQCDNAIYSGPVKNAGSIPVDIIVYDETGKYKRPTPASIEDLLGKVEHIASEGGGNSLDTPTFTRELRIAQQWAEIVGYNVAPERVQNWQKTWREAYLAKSEKNLPHILAAIEDREYGFNLEEDEMGINPYEYTGMQESMGKLLELLKENRIPANTELKTGVLEVLYRHRNMFDAEKERLEEKKKSLVEEIDGRIQGVRDSGLEAAITMDKYLTLAGLSKEEIDGARVRARVKD